MRSAQKVGILVALLLGFSPITFIAWYRWDSAQNRGYEIGYFGVFNRVRHALPQLPGVTIAREWANRDVTLEEFGFDIHTSTRKGLALDFQESDPIRKLSGESLKRALAERIREKEFDRAQR